jgi:hypothetical protein
MISELLDALSTGERNLQQAPALKLIPLVTAYKQSYASDDPEKEEGSYEVPSLPSSPLKFCSPDSDRKKREAVY